MLELREERIMKKMLSLLCVLCLACTAWADREVGCWTDPETGFWWSYNIHDDEAWLLSLSTRRDDRFGRVEIPSHFEGKPVTIIGERAFYRLWNLTGKVVIPPTVTEIGARAFYGCWRMTSITMPQGITYIGTKAFGNCDSLTSVTFYGEEPKRNSGKGVLTGMHGGAFSDCPNLTSFSIPKGIVHIERDAFRRCRKLASVEIPQEITSIGDRAFAGCTELSKVMISPNVMHIGKWAFHGCGGVSVAPDNRFYSSDPSGVLFSKSGEHLIQAPRDIGADAGYALPPQVKSILTYVRYLLCRADYVLPSKVTSIRQDAFSNCRHLTSVTLSPNLTDIGDRAFSYCTGLTSVTLPAKLTSVGDWAFSNCSALTSATVSGNAAVIGRNAFYNCSALTTLTLNEGVASIGSDAFRDCTDLTTVKLPASVTAIGQRAFAGCSRVTFVFAGPPPKAGTAAFSSKAEGTYPKAHAAAWRAVLKGDTGTWNRLEMAPAAR